MALTLKEQMAADVVPVFLNTNEFAEAVVHYPRGGDVSEPLTGIVELDEDDQTGVRIDDAMGTEVIYRGRLSLAAAVEVTVRERPELCSRFLVRNKLWRASGFCQVDLDMQCVWIERREKVTSRQTRTT